MPRYVSTTLGFALVLTLLLTRSGSAQHPAPPSPSGGPSAQEPAAPRMAPESMRPRQPAMQARRSDMMDHGGMMDHGDMMGRGGMRMQRHFEHMAQQLELSDAQRAQAQTFVRNHMKDIIRLRAELETLGVDQQALLEAEPMDLAKVKQALQATAAKKVDIRMAHLGAMQEVQKLLTPEQQQKFRLLKRHMMHGGGDMPGHDEKEEREDEKAEHGGRRERGSRGH